MKKLLQLLLAITILIFTLTLVGCNEPDNVIDRREVVCEIDENELPAIEKEIVVTETELIYIDRPLGVTENELKFLIYYTFIIHEEASEDNVVLRMNTENDTVIVDDTTYTFDEYIDKLFDYYEYSESWN